MSKNIFDDVSDRNIISGKRSESAKKDSSKEDAASSSKEPRKESSSSSSSSNRKSSSNETVGAIKELGVTMLAGFEAMNKSLDRFGTNLLERIDERLDVPSDEFQSEMEDEDELTNEENEVAEACDESENIFQILENSCGEKSGPELNPHLASLVDKLLKNEMNESEAKEMELKYPKPSNVQYASFPKVNKPIWEALKVNTKKADVKMQHVHKNILKSALPVAKVMQELYEAKDDLSKLKVKDLISTLAESLNFVGSANAQLFNVRKECIKTDLPRNMQGLCRDDSEVSPSLLFGEDLNGKIKQVSELNKVKNRFDGGYKGKNRYNNFRGRYPNFNRGRYQRRSNFVKRLNNYSKAKNGAPNKSGGSNKA